jgi:hypothetical protein
MTGVVGAAVGAAVGGADGRAVTTLEIVGTGSRTGTGLVMAVGGADRTSAVGTTGRTVGTEIGATVGPGS